MELLDHSDRPLHRVFAKVTREQSCDLLDTDRFRLTAYIGLRDDAAFVQLRSGDLVLWRTEIADAPTLEVTLAGRGLSRDEPARLRVKYSRPHEGAFMQVIYQWGERRFHTIEIREPAPEIRVELRRSPGGRACRFVVIYSNGVRSACAATRESSLDPLGPSVTIWQPMARAVMHPGQHLVLQGQVVDAERAGGARDEDSTWWLDGNPVGRGPIGGVDRVEPGRHRVELRYEGQGGTGSGQAAVTINVLRSDVCHADEWQPFDHWNGIA